ncbi:FecR domain-containing protein [Sphingomonas sp. HF-S3]|uniref:FecR domain-containing protein n=1 Tax=Sphingomonas rustica TaxID=3103142 RepID=A0ABV0B6R2_9SPHN
MTIAGGPAGEDRETLEREAAHWFARLRGPDAEGSRAEFETWLARGPGHLAAYNRAAEIFAMGKLLSEPRQPVPGGSADPERTHQPVPALAPAERRRVPSIIVASIAACVITLGGWAVLHRSGPGADSSTVLAATTDHRRITTVAGETRVVRLADGSTVHLGAGTILDVEVGKDQRILALSRGQARFEVAHERRPFIVQAGGGSVTARGTIFEVALTPAGKVDVRLLQGAVDVTLPRERRSAKPPIRKLAAGEGVSFEAQSDAPATSAVTIGETPAKAAVAREFEGVSVAELVALANRGPGRRINLTDGALAGERVSGRFRVDDTELLARRLGALFGRQVGVNPAGEIVLAPPGPAISGS